jgi:hypothetical protein
MIHTTKLRIPDTLGKRMFANGRDSEKTWRLCAFAREALNRKMEQCASKGAEARIVSRAKQQECKRRLDSWKIRRFRVKLLIPSTP